MNNAFRHLMTLAPDGVDGYLAPPSPQSEGIVFGGQLLAQSLMAAAATVPEGRPAHSLHACFLRPGDVHQPVELQVQRVRDGRTFCSREVSVRQAGRTCFRMMASFQAPAQSPEFVATPMPDVPPPGETATSYEEFVLGEGGEEGDLDISRSMEILYINPPMVRGAPVTEPQLMWLRIPEALSDAPGLHQAGLAYLSDGTVLDTALLVHGMRWQDPGFVGASLDHAMWFHASGRADEWLLYEQSAICTGAGRGLVLGRLFTRSGELAATCVQEGLMRWQC